MLVALFTYRGVNVRPHIHLYRSEVCGNLRNGFFNAAIGNTIDQFMKLFNKPFALISAQVIVKGFIFSFT